MKSLTRFTALCVVLLFAAAGFAQRFNASDFGQWRFTVTVGNTTTGSGKTVTVTTTQAVTPSGLAFNPFNTNAPITISGATANTLTPTSFSGCGAFNNSCVITGTISNLHNAGDTVSSGTAGLQEAINYASDRGGGVVVVDPRWTGTSAMLSAAVATSDTVAIEDIRSGDPVWYAIRPSTLTNIAVPLASTQVAVAPTGIAAATYRIAQTYVDALGGETLISDDSASTVTTTASLGTITVTRPAASAGAVGWRLYVSAAGGAQASEILYEPADAGCTQSQLVTTVLACDMNSDATFAALVTTKAKVPLQSTAHTTFLMQPFHRAALPFQQAWGPFTVSGVETAGASSTLGMVPLPAGFLNSLGKSVRICGTMAITPVINSAPTYTITVAPALGQSPVTLASFVIPGTTLTAVANTVNFCVTTTTAAIGATGTIETHGWLTEAIASTGAPYAGTALQDGNTAVSSAVDLTKQLYLSVVSTPATANITQGQLRQLTIEPLN